MVAPEPARRLYDLPPEEFTAERDGLAKVLKAEGRAEVAAAVKALRKPSVAAYALNVVARRHAELVAGLLDAEERLRSATSRTAMDGAKTDRQQAIAAIARQAQTLLEEQGRPVSAQVKEKLTATLLAVGTDDATRERLRGGELVREAVAGEGFGAPVVAFETNAEEEHARRLQERIDRLRRDGDAKLAEASRSLADADRAAHEAGELAEAAAAARERAAKLRKLAGQAENVGKQKLAEAEQLENG